MSGPRTAPARKRRARISFADFVERVYEPKYLAQKKPNTQRHERAIITAHLIEPLGPRSIDSIQPHQIQGLFGGQEHYLQVAIRTTAANVFTAARTENYLASNDPLPTDSAVVPDAELTPPPTLTLAEIRAAYKKLAMPFRDLALLVCLGPTANEALGAKLARWNLGPTLLTVDGKPLQPYSLSIAEVWDIRNGSARSTPISSQKRRVIPLARRWCERVAGYIEQRGRWQSPSDYPFVSQGGRTRGRPYNSNNARTFQLEPVEEELGINNLSWRCLRHSGAVLTDLIGLNSAERASLYGLRRDPITGSRRESIDPDRVREAVNELDACIAEGKELKRLPGATSATVGLPAAEAAGNDDPGDYNSPLARRRRAELFPRAMQKARDNRGGAAIEMGIDPKTLRKAENGEPVSKRVAGAIDTYNREHLDA